MAFFLAFDRVDEIETDLFKIENFQEFFFNSVAEISQKRTNFSPATTMAFLWPCIIGLTKLGDLFKI